MSERWKPMKGETYWVVGRDATIHNFKWSSDGYDSDHYDIGNCFKTEKEAQAAAEKIKTLLLRLHEEQPVADCDQLPKLTAEVFNRPDCPDWAKYAVVDCDGYAWWYKDVPTRSAGGKWFCEDTYWKGTHGIWDASDWQNSLVERPAELPEWCKVDAIGWHKRCGYFKVTDIDDDAKGVYVQRVDDKSKGYFSFNNFRSEAVHAQPRTYNEAEMEALVGKVLKHSTGAYLVTAFENRWNQVKIESIWREPSELAEFWNHLDGSPCDVLEHLNEKGEWVE